MLNAKVITKKSNIDGLGYFASAVINKDEVVMIWEGQITSNRELADIVKQGKYHSSIAIDEDINLLFEVIDPNEKGISSRIGSGTGGLNHSCDPNLWLTDSMTVSARRDIPPGEELTIDYSMFTVSPKFILENCNCGIELCRHLVTGNDWMLPDLQKRYKNHFSPFINKRIAINS